MLEPTQQFCDKSGGKIGQDNTTHHMRPRGIGSGTLICTYCRKTEKELRDA